MSTMTTAAAPRTTPGCGCGGGCGSGGAGCSCGSCACGTLAPFERPRFFSGQLLTERELNGEQSYVVDKNRLHNRLLHGYGVVCGLRVSCCDATHVTVEAGYALDPCGNDIVLAQSTTVDLLEARPRLPQPHADRGRLQPVPDDAAHRLRRRRPDVVPHDLVRGAGREAGRRAPLVRGRADSRRHRRRDAAAAATATATVRRAPRRSSTRSAGRRRPASRPGPSRPPRSASRACPPRP